MAPSAKLLRGEQVLLLEEEEEESSLSQRLTNLEEASKILTLEEASKILMADAVEALGQRASTAASLVAGRLVRYANQGLTADAASKALTNRLKCNDSLKQRLQEDEQQLGMTPQEFCEHFEQLYQTETAARYATDAMIKEKVDKVLRHALFPKLKEQGSLQAELVLLQHFTKYKSIWLKRAERNALGRAFWHSFDTVFVLYGQHRLAVDDADGQLLWRFGQVFATAGVTLAQVAEVADAIQGAAVTNLRLHVAENPYALVLRQAVRFRLDMKLVIMRAQHLGLRLCCWRSRDVVSKTGVALPQLVKDALAQIAPNLTGHVPALGYFFEGIEYVFVDNDAAPAGRMRNARCYGRAIVLHPHEALDAQLLFKRYRCSGPLQLC